MRLTRTELVAELPLLEGDLLAKALAWMQAHPHPLWLRPLAVAKPVQAAVRSALPPAPQAADLLTALRGETAAPALKALAGTAVAESGAKCIAGLAVHLGNADPDVRIGVIDALGAIRDDAVLGRLLAALVDPEPRVALVAARVVATYKSAAVLAAIDTALEGTDARAVPGALHALRFFDGAEARPRLTAGLLRRSPRERRLAAQGLAALEGLTPLPLAPALDPVRGRPLDPALAEGPLRAWLAAAAPEMAPPAFAEDAAAAEADRLWSQFERGDAAGRATVAVLGALGPADAWRARLAAAIEGKPAGRPSLAPGHVLPSRGKSGATRQTSIAPDVFALAEAAAIALARTGEPGFAVLSGLLSRGQFAAVPALFELAAVHAERVDALCEGALGDGPPAQLARVLQGVEERAAAAAAGAGDAPADDAPVPDARQLGALIQAGQVTPARLRRWLSAQRAPSAIVALLQLARELALPDRAELAAHFVQHPELSVRQAVLEVLVGATGKAADEALYLLIQDKEDAPARAAFDGLRQRSHEAARDALAPLLASGKPPLTRRGLLFLEALDDPTAWTMLLEVCRQPMADGVPEELARLVAAWCPGVVIEELERIHATASGLVRRGIKEIALLIGTRKGYTAAELMARFPDPVKKAPSSRAPGDPAADPTRSRVRAGAAVVSAVAVFVGLALTFSDPGRPVVRPSQGAVPAVAHVAIPPRVLDPYTRVNPSTPRSLPEVRAGGGVSDVLADVLKGQRRVSLASVEKQVAAELKAMGVHSARLIRAVALERVEERYKTRMKPAREIMLKGTPLQAIPVLEALLAEQDRDHHFARVEILKLAIRAAVQAQDMKEAKRLHDLLQAQKAKWIEMIAEAAAEAGADGGAIGAFKESYAEREKAEGEAFSVTMMFKPQVR